MTKTVDDVLREVKKNGDFTGVGPVRVVNSFSNTGCDFSSRSFGDNEGFSFEKRVYVFYGAAWYDATNHPASPFPEWRGSAPVKGQDDFPTPAPGYHLSKIEKRRFGSLGKIQEEVEELLDAHRQGSKIMGLVELADLYGAIQGFLEEEYPGMKMEDLKRFSDITQRAFKNGHR